ncbi:NAD(P)-dependent alcohol dehydrogenase, partial [Proteus mirabilis]
MAGVEFIEMSEKGPSDGQVKVRLRTAGLNRRDLMVTHRHGQDEPALILGSDGAGIVEEIGAGVQGLQVGAEVIINPGLGWPEKSDAPPAGFEILGLPDHGTFAETIIISAENVEPKPPHLTWEEAGVLPLAALTAYRALFTRGMIQSGQTLLLPGAGSGVITFILQMAKAVGAR